MVVRRYVKPSSRTVKDAVEIIIFAAVVTFLALGIADLILSI